MTNGLFQQFVEWIIFHGGFYLLLFIIFAETGLFVGFFLPGDSLLFLAGVYMDDIAANFFHVHPAFIVLLVILASVSGNFVGYWFGRKMGNTVYQWKDGLLFKRKYLERAHVFYSQYGAATIFLSKFLPILRTFAPIVGGIVNMKPKLFTMYNIAGSIVWVCLMMLGGYFLETLVAEKYHFSLKNNIEWITLILILVTTLPVILKLATTKRSRSKNENSN